MKTRLRSAFFSCLALVVVALLAGGAAAKGKGPVPEDFLKGKIIISDKAIPTSWTSVSAMGRP